MMTVDDDDGDGGMDGGRDRENGKVVASMSMMWNFLHAQATLN